MYAACLFTTSHLRARSSLQEKTIDKGQGGSYGTGFRTKCRPNESFTCRGFGLGVMDLLGVLSLDSEP